MKWNSGAQPHLKRRCFGAQICEWSDLSHCEPAEPICLEDRGWKDIGRTSILYGCIGYHVTSPQNIHGGKFDHEGADRLDDRF